MGEKDLVIRLEECLRLHLTQVPHGVCGAQPCRAHGAHMERLGEQRMKGMLVDARNGHFPNEVGREPSSWCRDGLEVLGPEM